MREESNQVNRKSTVPYALYSTLFVREKDVKWRLKWGQNKRNETFFFSLFISSKVKIFWPWKTHLLPMEKNMLFNSTFSFCPPLQNPSILQPKRLSWVKKRLSILCVKSDRNCFICWGSFGKLKAYNFFVKNFLKKNPTILMSKQG